MAIPNYQHIIEQTKKDYPRAWQHCHIAGDPEAWDFIILAGRRVYDENELFGLNGKRGNPAADQLSWDALNWQGDPDDPENVIDCVAGAGGPNPSVTWQITNSTGYWHNPYSFSTYYNYGDDSPEGYVPWVQYDENGFQELKRQLAYDYARRPQGADFDVSVWAARVFHSCYMGPEKEPLGMEAALVKHRAEWCAALGVPVVPIPPGWQIGQPV